MKAKVIVIGLGRSGIGAAKLLNYEGYKTMIFEEKKNGTYQDLAKKIINEGIEVKLGKSLEISSFEEFIPNISEIIISPSIPWDHPTLEILRSKEIRIESEVNFAWKRINHIPWFGITGTNGKTTVTYLLNHILNNNGLVAPMGGNMGLSATSIVLDIKQGRIKNPDYLIMELSSYQIESSPDINPYIGIWTSFTPDHLERHKSIENYRSIKKSLLDRSNIRIFNGDDVELNKNRSYLGEGIWISCRNNSNNNYWINDMGYIVEEGMELFNSSIIKIPGEHNIQNTLMATAAARKVGLSSDQIKSSIISFKGVPHRLEKILEKDELTIINDSKATNYDAAITGLRAIQSPSIVIAGGRLKKGDPKNWVQQIKKSAIAIILIGESAFELKGHLKRSNYKGTLLTCEKLEEAIHFALDIEKQYKPKSIILSPAASSFDQYKNFEERGDRFREIIVQKFMSSN